jgi:hypothetical protein
VTGFIFSVTILSYKLLYNKKPPCTIFPLEKKRRRRVVLIYFILSLLTLFVVVGVTFLTAHTNYFSGNYKMQNGHGSAFDVPSIFNHSYNKNQIHFNWNAKKTNVEKQFISPPLPDKTTGQNNLSTWVVEHCKIKFSYTHITERMTIVHTNY